MIPYKDPTSPDAAHEVWVETEEALTYTKSRMEDFEPLLGQYRPGLGLSGRGGSDSQDPETLDIVNQAFAYVSWVVPNLIFDNPAVDLTSPRKPLYAMAYEAAANRWILSTQLRQTLIALAVDHALLWGIAVVSRERRPELGEVKDEHVRPVKEGGDGDEPIDPKKEGVHAANFRRDMPVVPRWPMVSRIPQERFFRDAAAHTISEAAFEGHEWVRPTDEVMAEAETDSTWNKDSLEDYIDSYQQIDRLNSGKDNVPPRDEIRAREVWFPGITLDSFPEGMGEGAPKPEDGYHGTVFTLAAYPAVGTQEGKTGEKQAWLRAPRPFYGPRWGPYVQFGVHCVPNETFPMSNLVALKPQLDATNRAHRAMQRSAESFKVPLLYDAADTAIASAIQDAKDQQFVGVPNLFDGSGRPRVILGHPIGGVQAEQIQWAGIIGGITDRLMGFTDMQQGQAQAGRTATADSIASANADVRLYFIKQQWIQGVEQIMRTVVWYMAIDDQVVLQVGGQDLSRMKQAGAIEGDVQELTIQGGDMTPADLDQMDLRIRPYSMERTDEGVRQARTMEAMQWMLGLVQTAAQLGPIVPWSEWVDWMGDALNMPEMGKLLPPEAFEGLGGQAPGPGQPGGPQPRVRSDSGPGQLGGGAGSPGLSFGPQGPPQGMQTGAAAGAAMAG